MERLPVALQTRLCQGIMPDAQGCARVMYRDGQAEAARLIKRCSRVCAARAAYWSGWFGEGRPRSGTSLLARGGSGDFASSRSAGFVGRRRRSVKAAYKLAADQRCRNLLRKGADGLAKDLVKPRALYLRLASAAAQYLALLMSRGDEVEAARRLPLPIDCCAR